MENLLKILTKPDNVPIVGLLFLAVGYTWYGLWRAHRNDRWAATSYEKVHGDRVHVWPFLVRNEFIGAIVVMAILTFWSIYINAPLEEPANPSKTPNPSKAPWYFLGLQEMLVYFDPWIAGVVLPTLIIVGLIAIPYIDVNPRGNGYYTFKERRFAIITFLFGFLVLWVALIIVGTFMRGPGWNFFAPWEAWDTHKVVSMTNVDLPYAFGLRGYWSQFAFGAVLVLGYFSLVLPGYFAMKKTAARTLEKMGKARYALTAFLFLSMLSLPLKMFLRIGFNIKYIWVTPWFNI
jgi:hypothetical protein